MCGVFWAQNLNKSFPLKTMTFPPKTTKQLHSGANNLHSGAKNLHSGANKLSVGPVVGKTVFLKFPLGTHITFVVIEPTPPKSIAHEAPEMLNPKMGSFCHEPEWKWVSQAGSFSFFTWRKRPN